MSYSLKIEEYWVQSPFRASVIIYWKIFRLYRYLVKWEWMMKVWIKKILIINRSFLYTLNSKNTSINIKILLCTYLWLYTKYSCPKREMIGVRKRNSMLAILRRKNVQGTWIFFSHIQWGKISIRTLENFYFNVYKYI